MEKVKDYNLIIGGYYKSFFIFFKVIRFITEKENKKNSKIYSNLYLIKCYDIRGEIEWQEIYTINDFLKDSLYLLNSKEITKLKLKGILI
jgi:hypothetical protein